MIQTIDTIKSYFLTGDQPTQSNFNDLIDTLSTFENIVDITYTELISNIGASTLEAGRFYLLTDFRTIYDVPDFYYSDNNSLYAKPKAENTITNTCSVEPLIIYATSNNTISNNVLSPSYPNDMITYDYTFALTETMGVAAKGRITSRLDVVNNNRTDYDFRNIVFKRYQQLNVNNTALNGTITFTGDGTSMNGTSTNFTTQLLAG
jgi:hypothetical protein